MRELFLTDIVLIKNKLKEKGNLYTTILIMGIFLFMYCKSKGNYLGTFTMTILIYTLFFTGLIEKNFKKKLFRALPISKNTITAYNLINSNLCLILIYSLMIFLNYLLNIEVDIIKEFKIYFVSVGFYLFLILSFSNVLSKRATSLLFGFSIIIFNVLKQLNYIGITKITILETIIIFTVFTIITGYIYKKTL